MASSISNLGETSDFGISEGNLLVLVIDVNPDQRTFLTKPVQRLTKWIDSGLALVNSHLLLHPSNEVAVIAASKRSCKFLFPDGSPNITANQEEPSSSTRDGQFEGFRDIEKIIRHRAHGMIIGEMKKAQETSQPLVTSDSLVAGGLCMALSYINRKRKDLELPSVSRTSQENVGHLAKEASDTKTSPQDLQARILVMTASGSTATQYMNYMNAFFTAQVKSLALMRYFTR
jgi:transcription initiation factor TFIIH subunit 3